MKKTRIFNTPIKTPPQFLYNTNKYHIKTTPHIISTRHKLGTFRKPIKYTPHQKKKKKKKNTKTNPHKNRKPEKIHATMVNFEAYFSGTYFYDSLALSLSAFCLSVMS